MLNILSRLYGYFLTLFSSKVKFLFQPRYNLDNDQLSDLITNLLNAGAVFDNIELSKVPDIHIKIISHKLSQYYFEIKNYDKALSYAYTCIEDHQCLKCLRVLAASHYYNQNYNESLNYCNKLLDTNNADYLIYEMSAVILFIKGDFDRALNLFLNALSLEDSLTVRGFLSIISAKKGNYDKAREHAIVYRSRIKNKFKALVLDGKVEMDSGNYSEAFNLSVESTLALKYYNAMIAYAIQQNLQEAVLVGFSYAIDNKSIRLEYKHYFEAVVATRKLKRFSDAREIAEKANIKFSKLIETPVFSYNDSLEVEFHSEDKPLIIAFQGFKTALVRKINLESPSFNIESLIISKLKFAFKGFSHTYDNYNYIFVKDNYQVWYQINTDKYLEAIREQISFINPSKIICVGQSAGAYAAILFGQLLKADLVFAFAPRPIAFTTSLIGYRVQLNKSLLLGMQETSDLMQVIDSDGGLIPKTYIYYCSNEKTDSEAVLHFDHDDSKIRIIRVDGYSHDVVSVIGKEKAFEKMANLIDTY